MSTKHVKRSTVTLWGESSDASGDVWRIRFALIPTKRGNRVMVTARCTTKRAPMLSARNNCNQILELWPLEFWPQFAKPLATHFAIGNDNTRQEALFS